MAITQTARRAILVAVILIILFLFLRPSSSSAPEPSLVEGVHKSNTPIEGEPTRSYPPPGRAKGEEQEQEIIPGLSSTTLREKIKYHFPYYVKSKFPAYIWQTWKRGPGSGDFEDRLRPLEASWSEKHPTFVHEVITDEAALHLISYLYSSVPEVVEAYEAMPLPVIKADFFRYLILLARGGIYADIDTAALQSAVDWLPSNFDRSAVGIIIGIEADPDREDWALWYSRRIQFCQWTIQAKPGHPILADIVATITADTLQMKQANLLKKGRLPPKSVVEYTGPAVWTDAVFSYLNNRDYFDFSSRRTNVSASDFFAITEHKKIGDVVVLPITSFSPGVNQMGAGGLDDPMAFVKHSFDGSWKPANERMNGE